jgi:hypothetical protein
MKITLAFDVYGTVGDPSGMAKHLGDDPGPEMGRCFLKIRSTTGRFFNLAPELERNSDDYLQLR